MLGLKSHEASERCPYCHAGLDEGDALWACPGCATTHHRECARENRQCTVLGCAHAVVIDGVAVGASPRAAARSQQDVLVLGVCLGALGALGLGERLVSQSAEFRAVPFILALGVVGLIGLGVRALRRRNAIGG